MVILNIFSIGLGIPQPHVDITVVVGVTVYVRDDDRRTRFKQYI